LHFEDSFDVSASPDTVWEFITTPSEFIKVIPDLVKQEVKDSTHFSVSFKMGLGMIRGTVNMAFEIKDPIPKSSLRLVGKGNGLQSSADLAILLNLSAEGKGTHVAWSADLNVAGTAVGLGARFIEPVTRSKVKEIVEGIRRELNPPA
jgi:carbon monoxide dehydrogenase subunit G